MGHILLFESREIAESIAYSLRGKWDECNSVTVQSLDFSALTLALSLSGASLSQYCYLGEYCSINSVQFPEQVKGNPLEVIAEKYLEIVQKKIISLIPEKFKSWHNFWRLFISTIFIFTLIDIGLRVLNYEGDVFLTIFQGIVKKTSAWAILVSCLFLIILWVLERNNKLEEPNNSDDNQELLISSVYLIIVSTILAIASLKILQVLVN
ncbi:MAG: hypothetical protein AB4062_13880 [Crocosphaera sp.]